MIDLTSCDSGVDSRYTSVWLPVPVNVVCPPISNNTEQTRGLNCHVTDNYVYMHLSIKINCSFCYFHNTSFIHPLIKGLIPPQCHKGHLFIIYTRQNWPEFKELVINIPHSPAILQLKGWGIKGSETFYH